MPTSLFIEHRTNGLAFYINGDLQFDTGDEAVYHEYLVVPAVALAVQRFPQTNLRVLICGGGDGLAARDVLRFAEVGAIDLVDFSSEVIEIANTVFLPYNGGSLQSDRVTVRIQEAFEFVAAVPDNSYHAVICDFTYPNTAEETAIYSREWFQEINRILIPDGIVSTNGVSPEKRALGFWCLYQTLLSAGLTTKPLAIKIPSFEECGFGIWGFLLGSPTAIKRDELKSIALTDSLQSLTREQLFNSFKFPENIAKYRREIAIHTLGCPQLFYYLLNPETRSTPAAEKNIDETVDFLEIEELGIGKLASRDRLQLESIVKAWLEQIYESPDAANYQDFSQFLPVQHRYHSPQMVEEWLTYLKQALAEVDISRLLKELLDRSAELPPKFANNFQQLATQIKTGQPLSKLPPQTAQFIITLSVVLLMANFLTPDAVFAKGFYSGSSSSSSNSSGGDGSGFTKTVGFISSIGALYWLWNILFDNSDDE